MKNQIRIACAAAAALWLGACSQTPTVDETPNKPAETTATSVSAEVSEELSPIADLVGTWVRVDQDGKNTDEIVSVYRVTAGGSAIAETLFPGGSYQMETLYHVEAGKIVLTHYCMLGNRPRMVLQDESTTDVLVFQCEAGCALDTSGEEHMHRGVVNRLGPDRLRTEWSHYDPSGADADGVVFELARVTP